MLSYIRDEHGKRGWSTPVSVDCGQLVSAGSQGPASSEPVTQLERGRPVDGKLPTHSYLEQPFPQTPNDLSTGNARSIVDSLPFGGHRKPKATRPS